MVKPLNLPQSISISELISASSRNSYGKEPTELNQAGGVPVNSAPSSALSPRPNEERNLPESVSAAALQAQSMRYGDQPKLTSEQKGGDDER